MHRRPCLWGQPICPAQQYVSQRGREFAEPAGVEQFLRDEGIAARAAYQRGLLIRVQRTPQRGLRKLRQLLIIEASEQKPHHSSVRHKGTQHVAGARVDEVLVVPERQQDEMTGRQVPGQEGNELNRGSVCPVQILQNEDLRPTGGRVSGHTLERELEHLRAAGCRPIATSAAKLSQSLGDGGQRDRLMPHDRRGAAKDSVARLDRLRGQRLHQCGLADPGFAGNTGHDSAIEAGSTSLSQAIEVLRATDHPWSMGVQDNRRHRGRRLIKAGNKCAGVAGGETRIDATGPAQDALT